MFALGQVLALVGELFHGQIQILACGVHRVLQTHLLSAVGVPEEYGAFPAALDAVNADQILALGDGVIGRHTAAKVDVHGAVALGDIDVIGPGRTDAGQLFDLAVILENGQEPGDTALGQHLVDDVGLGDAPLGQSLNHVVDHHGHRTGVQGLVRDAVAQTGEGVHVALRHEQVGVRLGGCLGGRLGGRFGRRLRRGLGRGFGGGHGLRIGRNRLLTAGSQQRQSQTKCHQKGNQTGKLVQTHILSS